MGIVVQGLLNARVLARTTLLIVDALLVLFDPCLVKYCKIVVLPLKPDRWRYEARKIPLNEMKEDSRCHDKARTEVIEHYSSITVILAVVLKIRAKL